jgi:ribonucleoside-diphosphate reductase alpha chain
MKMVNEIGHHVRSGKNRRTALIAILNVTHPDLLEFLHVKLSLNELTNFNISIGITNDFIDAVRKDAYWTFKFNGREYKLFRLERWENDKTKIDTVDIAALNVDDAVNRAKQHWRISQNTEFRNVSQVGLKARDIWDLMIQNSWKSGDPGIYNIDLANTLTNVSYFESVPNPNPCGEIPLPPYGNCCLGHVNLSNMYDESKNDVNWKKLASTIRLGIRFLDNVLSANHYPIPDCKVVGEKSRRIGLGVTGLHYLLLKIGYKYGDEKCLEFLDRLFATFRNEAYLASIDLAKEKGSFPAFNAEKFSKELFFSQLPPRIQNLILKSGIRNAVMLTIAPCGTNSMVLGVSSGIEPIFAPMYERSFRSGNIWQKEIVIDKLFKEFYLTNKPLDHFVSAYDVSVEQHISVQATIQKYIDSAISKTTNIPENYPVEKLSDVILEYAKYVKGFTIYRTNSRGLEPLKPLSIKSKEELRILMNKDSSNSAESLSNCKDGSCEFIPNK